MSARKLPRELGVVIRCDIDAGMGRCTTKLQTAAVYIKHNRTWAKSQGWLRGKYPRGLFDLECDDAKKGALVMRDVCPEHAPIAKAALADRLAARAAKRKAKDEKRAAAAIVQCDIKRANAPEVGGAT